jgi:flagellar hook protein FlgE
MMRSLFAGVSGLRNHQVRMDVIGNNVANVNTVAFKGSRVTFKEGFAQLLQGASRPPGDHGGTNPIQVGLGMQVGSIDQMFTQGNLETTGQNTDLAIQGDAFFVVAKGNQHFYTRSGNFQLDGDGRLVSPTNGFVVQGRTAVNGVLQEGVGDIKLPFGQKTAAKQTTKMTLAGNLDAAAPTFTGPFISRDQTPPTYDFNGTTGTDTSTPVDFAPTAHLTFGASAPSGDYQLLEDGSGNFTLYRNGIAESNPTAVAAGGTVTFTGYGTLTLDAGYTAGDVGNDLSTAPAATLRSTPTIADPANASSYTSTTISAYDSLGTKHELKVWLYKKDATTWNYVVDDSGLVGVPATGAGALSGNTGSLSFNTDGTLNLNSPNTQVPDIQFTPAGAEPVTIKMNPGSGVNGITQFASTSTAVLRDQDGYGEGDLVNFTIDRTGTITGSFSNGTNVTLGQIVLADFNNPSGLQRSGDNMYTVSGNSGSPVLGYALEGSQSFITSGALEMSNVDIANEFTNMIVTQRGFQANGRVITTSDQMLQDVVNLKQG